MHVCSVLTFVLPYFFEDLNGLFVARLSQKVGNFALSDRGRNLPPKGNFLCSLSNIASKTNFRFWSNLVSILTIACTRQTLPA